MAQSGELSMNSAKAWNHVGVRDAHVPASEQHRAPRFDVHDPSWTLPCALDQLALLVCHNGALLGWNDVLRYIQPSIDLVMHLKHTNGVREISDVTMTYQ